MTLNDAVFSRDPKTQIRLKQWAITLVIYIASGLVLTLGVSADLLGGRAVAQWGAFVAVGLVVFYAAMRIGWHPRFADAAFTEWQIAFGVVAVLWGYVMCGDLRSATLFPLMVTLTFGAFSLSWRRMAALTLLTLVALGVTMAWLRHSRPSRFDAHVDAANFLIAAVMLPATSVLASKLGALRSRLCAQRNELTEALATIQELAIRDELTGLVNRRHAQQLLEDEARRSERSAEPFSIALIDLDHFKRINDVHGHAGGDAVLKAFADEARHTVRACDVIARWGGEEFLLIMPATDARSALLAVERVRRRVEQLHVLDGAIGSGITLSAGVAEHLAGERVADVLARADEALYRAKGTGRNRVIVAGRARAGAAGDTGEA